MSRLTARFSTGLALMAVLSLITIHSTPASADYSSYYPGSFFVKVVANDGVNTGTWEAAVPTIGTNPFNWAPNYGIPGQAFYSPNNTLMGYINYFDITTRVIEANVSTNNRIQMSFAITAPSNNVSYTITSTAMSIVPIDNPKASANASLTVTDNFGDGGWATGGYANGTKSFKAMTNLGDFALTPIVGNVTVQFPQSSSGSSESTGALQYIYGTVNQMQTEFSFTLNRDDQASGSSSFTVVVPEPGSMVALASGILGFGALFLRKRTV